MLYLFTHWESVERALRPSRHRLFLFDYDGTLAPLAPTPQRAKMSQGVRRRLEKLARKTSNSVAVVSGRGLEDVQAMVKLPLLQFAGNHGLEIKRGSRLFTYARARKQAPMLRQFSRRLRSEIKDIPGAWVEEKGLSLSVHDRLTPRPQRSLVARVVRKLLDHSPHAPFIILRRGKKVTDILPNVRWNKGQASLWFKRRMPRDTAVVYVGDDRTDETAFRALSGPRQVTIRVGRWPGSYARYFLKAQHEVPLLLNQLLALDRPKGEPDAVNTH